jgi:hypothetical protein
VSDFLNSLTLSSVVKPINHTGGTGEEVIHDTSAGKIFVVTYIFWEGATNYEFHFQSGSTQISGQIGVAHAADEDHQLGNGGAPLLIGRAAGDDFIMDFGNAATCHGWAVIAEISAEALLI